MSFQLLNEEACVKGSQTYMIRLYFDQDTNTQKHEYSLDDQVLYHIEYEALSYEVPNKDISLESIVLGFHDWYDEFGPNWRPVAF